MPKIRTSKKKKPAGWDLIEPTLEEFETKMREAINEPHEGKRKTELDWPIFRIHHQRSKYIYDMFFKKKEITRELYEFCLDENIADRNLISKWRKQGYEVLCCIKCIQTKDHNFSTCICRVPKKELDENRGVIECANCGCKGCSSGDS